MTFKTATVTQRMAVRDSSYRLGNLAERLTLGHGPVDSGLGTEIDALAIKMQSALADAGYTSALPDGTAPVKSGDSVTVTTSDAGTLTAPAKATVTGNTLSGVKMTVATDALVQDGLDISIQDRNNVTLLGSGVKARVSRGGLISAYFTGLNQGINSDGNPLDITTSRGGSTTTGRCRVYVAANQVRNVYLDATAALQSGVTVPVQNSIGQNIQPGTVTVTNNLVASVKLPANYTAFGDGIAHKVTDGAGKTAQATAKVSGGVLQDQTLVGTVALVSDGQVLTVNGGTVTLAIANGVITATYAPTA